MEKVKFQNTKKENLIGILHKPEIKSESGVIISHGFTSNKDRDRLVKLGEELAKNGFATLRFDFGGCGESDDREITVKNQVDDLKSAISYMKEKGYSNIALAGESLGALTSIHAYEEDVKTLVLIAPVTGPKKPSIIQKEELKHELKDKEFMIYKKDNKNFKITKEYFEERLSVNQEEIISKLKCPVLIIHGDKDPTIPLEQSKSAMKYLSKDSKLEIIKDGDHSLDDKIEQVILLMNKWFKKHLQ